jgi:hypothetical protein
VRYPDIDKLLREERFEELAQLGALPAQRLTMASRSTWRDRMRRVMRALAAPTHPAEPGVLTIRQADRDDAHAIARLADMDELPAPRGRVLVAEIESQILAALPLEGGPVVAHPLRATGGLVDLLEARARQLEASEAQAA